MSSRLLTTGLGCWALLLLVGCSTLTPARLFTKKVQFASAERPASEIICLWEPGEGKNPDGKPARGFNGTILFFNHRDTVPIGAHGKLTFYVYDDYGPQETWSKPLTEYTFSPEEWDSFFTMGALGPCYRIFIPYERQHPYQVNTSLWVKFEPADGRQGFYSRRTPLVLPGPLMEVDRVQVHETVQNRDRSPEKLQEIVAASFHEPAGSKPQDSRIHTLHRWDAGSRGSRIQQTNYEVTQGNQPAGAYAGPSASAPGADAESWGSTPPALPTTDESAPFQPRRRFKLGAPE